MALTRINTSQVRDLESSLQELSAAVDQKQDALVPDGGLAISGSTITATSSLLDDVTQVISSGAVARGGSDGSGGYFYVTDSGATMGVSGGYRISCGDTVNIRTTDNAMINLSGQATRIYANSRLSISCAATATQILAGGTTNTYILVSNGNYVYIKHSSDASRQIAVHMGMSATSDTLGIVRPDNSTCTVDSAGTLTCVVSGGAVYSAGPGIGISNSQISVSVDSSTVGFDSNGALSCMVSGGSGGTSYSAGPGIEITDGGAIMATSSLLDEVTQRISGSGYVVQTTSSPGEYMYFNGNGGLTLGASGTWRISMGASTAALRCGASTGLYMSGLVTSLANSGRVHYSATTGILNLYGSSTSTGIRMDSVCTMKNRGDSGYSAIIHEGMSATSYSMGITRPDNSTMIVNGGIMSVNPPVTEWTSGNAGSEVTYSQISGAQVLNLYRNGLLMQSGEDYTLSDGVVSYATPLASSEKVAFQYWPVPAPTRGLMKGSPGNDGALPDELPEENSGETGEER